MRRLKSVIFIVCFARVTWALDNSLDDKNSKLGAPYIIDLGGGAGTTTATAGTSTSTTASFMSNLSTLPVVLGIGVLSLYLFIPLLAAIKAKTIGGAGAGAGGLLSNTGSSAASYGPTSSSSYANTYDSTYAAPSTTYSRALKQQNDFIVKAITSIDPVDTAFNFLEIESKECRKRAICELERRLATTPVTTYAMKYMSSYVPGLEKYKESVDAGLEHLDCAARHPQCPHSLIQLMNKPRRRH